MYVNIPSNILFVQKWNYSFSLETGASPWTSDEKSHFLESTKRLIDRIFGGKVYAYITGAKTPLGISLQNIAIPVSFEILWNHGYTPETTWVFAHTIGFFPRNNNMARLQDEYLLGNPSINDRDSLMNHGSQLRERHFDYIKEVLNKNIGRPILNGEFVIRIFK